MLDLLDTLDLDVYINLASNGHVKLTAEAIRKLAFFAAQDQDQLAHWLSSLRLAHGKSSTTDPARLSMLHRSASAHA